MILVVGLFASALSLFLYSLLLARCHLLGVRFVHGFMEGLIVPAAFTFLANRAEESKRGKSVAISGAFVGLAAIIGPAYGGIVAAKTSTPFIMAVNGGIMLITRNSAFFVLRSFTYVRKQSTKQAQRFPSQNLFRSPRDGPCICWCIFLNVFTRCTCTCVAIKSDHLDLIQKQAGLLLSTFGVIAILIFLLPINRFLTVFGQL